MRYVPRMWRWELVSRLATDLGVTAMAVDTKDGLILSKVQDRTVLPWLAQARSFGRGQEELMDRFRQTLSGGGTYLDIGANLGVTTIPLARQSGVAIHAFEPDPVNFRMLRANLAINCPAHGISLHEIALGDEDRTLELEVNPNNPGDNRLAGSGRAAMGEDGWHQIQVQVRRLDTMIGRFSKPLAVKIDTQGAELRVVAGGRRTLAEAALICVEWCPYLLRRVGGDPEPMFSLVASFPRASIVAGDRGHQPQWQSGGEVAERMRVALAESADPALYYDVLATR